MTTLFNKEKIRKQELLHIKYNGSKERDSSVFVPRSHHQER